MKRYAASRIVSLDYAGGDLLRRDGGMTTRASEAALCLVWAGDSCCRVEAGSVPGCRWQGWLDFWFDKRKDKSKYFPLTTCCEVMVR